MNEVDSLFPAVFVLVLCGYFFLQGYLFSENRRQAEIDRKNLFGS